MLRPKQKTSPSLTSFQQTIETPTTEKKTNNSKFHQTYSFNFSSRKTEGLEFQISEKMKEVFTRDLPGEAIFQHKYLLRRRRTSNISKSQLRVLQKKQRLEEQFTEDKQATYKTFQNAIHGREKTYLNFVMKSHEFEESQQLKGYAKTVRYQKLFSVGDFWARKQVAKYMRNEDFTKERLIFDKLTQEAIHAKKQEQNIMKKALTSTSQTLIDKLYKPYHRIRNINVSQTQGSLGQLIAELDDLHDQNINLYQKMQFKKLEK